MDGLSLSILLSPDNLRLESLPSFENEFWFDLIPWLIELLGPLWFSWGIYRFWELLLDFILSCFIIYLVLDPYIFAIFSRVFLKVVSSRWGKV